MSTASVRSEIASPYITRGALPRAPEKAADTEKADAPPRDSVEVGAPAAPVTLPAITGAEAEATSLSVAQKVAAGAILGLTLLTAFGCSGGGPAAGTAPEAPRDSVSTVVEAPAGPGAGALTSIPSEAYPGIGTGLEATAQAQAVDAAEESAEVRQIEGLEMHDALRIDIVRQTYTEAAATAQRSASVEAQGTAEPAGPAMQSTGEAAAGSVTKTRELSPFGVDIGDGLFYDINGNLTFNPLKLNEEYRRITVDPAGALNSTTVTKKGGTVRIDPAGMFNSTVITREGGRMVIDTPGRWNETTVTQKNGQTTVSPFGIQGLVSPTRITEGDGVLRYNPPGLFDNTVITSRGDRTHISVPGWMNDMSILKTGDTTRVEYTGWANDIVITKSGGRTTIDPCGLGNSIVVTRSADKIRVDPPGLGNSVIITIRK